MDKIPCLGVYPLDWDRTTDPLITRREHEPVRHSTPISSANAALLIFLMLRQVNSDIVRGGFTNLSKQEMAEWSEIPGKTLSLE